jgi:formate dehydrogenase subunit gamma
MPHQSSQDKIVRYSASARLAHWAVAIAYIALFLSGLALFHPFFFWLSAIFGGPTLMRILHPFVGVAFAILFYVWAARLWKDNLWTRGDSAWVKNSFKYMNKAPGGEVPVEGKYNAGQKLMYWSMIVVILALLVSGIFIWRPYVAPAISAPAKQLSAVVHAIMAFIMFVGIGIHIYAAYWTKGSIRAMTRGTVSRKWARVHHPGWYEKVVAAPKEGP